MTQNPQNVFVVHGRNLEARDALFRFLRSIGLKPLEWSQAVKETGKAAPYIGEILDVAFSKAQAVVVLMTPDDEARLREPYRSPNDPSYESQLTGQARPNVLFEAGMAIGRSPDRTIIIELGTLRPFSDIGGRHVIRLSNSTESRQELAQRLTTAGCAVDLTGTDWHREGDFNTKLNTAVTTPGNAVRVLSKKINIGVCAVTYPQITGLEDAATQAKINAFLREMFISDQEEKYGDLEEDVDVSSASNYEETNDSEVWFGEETVSYETKLNFQGLLSIKYNYYGDLGGAHPIHSYQSFTLNLENGHVYSFSELFRWDSDYLNRINQLISYSLREQEDAPTDFTKRDEYEFYLTRKHLVLINIYDYHAAQHVEASIKILDIADLINLSGPLQLLLKK